ncbi:MAG: hypothetical protein K0R26_2429 [Bacteroidota bacterium]|jgi:hypothetical protein|nr:hypothetical protein [Bacteroidota bacterium]
MFIYDYLSRKPSVGVILLACLTIIQVHLNLVKYRFEDVIKWDVTGYYSYLPAVIIEKDVRLNFINDSTEAFYAGSKYAYIDDDNGNHVLKYPMGMSVLYAPFFLLAHLLASPLGYPSDGFSDIYQLMIQFSGLFYVFVGLLHLRKLLLEFFNEKISAVSLIFVFFGTNLLYYSAVEAAMSHAYTFSLFSVFLSYVHRFYQSPAFKFVLILSLCAGFIILIRPFNVFLVLALFLYGISSRVEFRQRLSFIRTHPYYFISFICIASLIVLPQFLYYLYVTGNFLVFSYGAEKFYFEQPHIVDFLVGFRKGWFIYTPVMAIAVLGIFRMRNHLVSPFRLSVMIILPLYVYLLSSWWCWWYGGSFSQRAMIDIYPLLALSLTCVFETISRSARNLKVTFYGFLIFLLMLNIFQTIQYKYNIIDYDGMTFNAYVNVFGSLDSDRIDSTLLDKPDYENAVKGLSE